MFNQVVYGNYSPTAVTVIFDRFPGIGDTVYRYTTTVLLQLQLFLIDFLELVIQFIDIQLQSLGLTVKRGK